MIANLFLQQIEQQLDQLREQGLYKYERSLHSPQGSEIKTADQDNVLNFCANNYLGLANDPHLVHCAQQALVEHGFGMASVRFICGTQAIHQLLEQRISQFLNKEACILYSSCFDANGGLFHVLLTEEDAIISDELNHASIIDGIRLCKAKRYRYHNNDMADLQTQLIAADAAGVRHKLIATDGVFSMDGTIANLPQICDLAEQYQAMVMVDDSHAVGLLGDNGGGTPEYYGVQDRIDMVTGTLGKALGGASGGFIVAPKPIVEWLRNHSRPYLFSNTLAPVITATSLAVLELLPQQRGRELRQQLHENSAYFRQGLSQLGFSLIEGEHPIIPIMLRKAILAQQMAAQLLQQGIYVVGFAYPVVPLGKARIRVQISAVHKRAQLDRALAAFASVGKTLGVIN